MLQLAIEPKLVKHIPNALRNAPLMEGNRLTLSERPLDERIWSLLLVTLHALNGRGEVRHMSGGIGVKMISPGVGPRPQHIPTLKGVDNDR